MNGYYKRWPQVSTGTFVPFSSSRHRHGQDYGHGQSDGQEDEITEVRESRVNFEEELFSSDYDLEEVAIKPPAPPMPVPRQRNNQQIVTELQFYFVSVVVGRVSSGTKRISMSSNSFLPSFKACSMHNFFPFSPFSISFVNHQHCNCRCTTTKTHSKN